MDAATLLSGNPGTTEMRALTLALLLSPLAAPAGEAPRSAFGPGEQLTFAVSYLGVRAGTAQLTVGWKMEQDGTEVWPLVCVGQTTDLAAVYPLRDRFVSYWDPKRQRAVGADFFVDENKKRRRDRFRYDTGAKKAFITRQAEGQPPVEREYDIEDGTEDLAAAGYGLRNVPLEVGAVHEVPIFTGHKVYRLRATVEAREPVTTTLGTFDAYRVSVNGDFTGGLRTRGNMTIWYTADARQLPVRGEAEFFIGAVVLDAVRYEPGRSAGAAE